MDTNIQKLARHALRRPPRGGALAASGIGLARAARAGGGAQRHPRPSTWRSRGGGGGARHPRQPRPRPTRSSSCRTRRGWWSTSPAPTSPPWPRRSRWGRAACVGRLHRPVQGREEHRGARHRRPRRRAPATRCRRRATRWWSASARRGDATPPAGRRPPPAASAAPPAPESRRGPTRRDRGRGRSPAEPLPRRARPGRGAVAAAPGRRPRRLPPRRRGQGEAARDGHHVGHRAEGRRRLLATDGEVARFEVIELRNPPRLAIDLSGVAKAPRAPVPGAGAFEAGPLRPRRRPGPRRPRRRRRAARLRGEAHRDAASPWSPAPRARPGARRGTAAGAPPRTATPTPAASPAGAAVAAPATSASPSPAGVRPHRGRPGRPGMRSRAPTPGRSS